MPPLAPMSHCPFGGSHHPLNRPSSQPSTSISITSFPSRTSSFRPPRRLPSCSPSNKRPPRRWPRHPASYHATVSAYSRTLSSTNFACPATGSTSSSLLEKRSRFRKVYTTAFYNTIDLGKLILAIPQSSDRAPSPTLHLVSIPGRRLQSSIGK